VSIAAKTAMIAARAEDIDFLESALDKTAFQSSCVTNYKEATQALSLNYFDLILCTIDFDDSQMISLLLFMRLQAEPVRTHFLCVQLHPTSSEIVDCVRLCYEAFGAAGFVEIENMDDAGAELLRSRISSL
jgi:DNA-binding NtrC family response regulator